MTQLSYWQINDNIELNDTKYSESSSSLQLTCKLHELVKVLDREDWFSQLSQIQFENSSHRVDIIAISHVSQRILASLKWLTEVVDLGLEIKLFVTGVTLDILSQLVWCCDASLIAVYNEWWAIVADK